MTRQRYFIRAECDDAFKKRVAKACQETMRSEREVVILAVTQWLDRLDKARSEGRNSH